MKIKRLLFFLVSVVVVSLLAFVYNIFFVPLNSNPNTRNIFVVDRDMSAKAFVQSLKDKNIFVNDKFLLAYLKFTGKAKRLKAGTFAINPNDSIVRLVARIENFDILKKNFLIIAGTTNAQVAANLQKAEFLNYSKLDWGKVFSYSPELNIVCAEDPLNYSSSAKSKGCMEVLQVISEPENLEGLFLADTYSYHAGSSAVNLLTVANANLKKHLFKAWQNRQIGLPYNSPYELLIAASILEKESALQNERRIISGIIVNRLRRKMPLQMDPTVIYGLKNSYSGKLRHADLQIATKYNTYKNTGLPPTPIAIVSKDAIDAASNPEITDFLYFVATGNGAHVFSKTYAEQRTAIKQYIRNVNE